MDGYYKIRGEHLTAIAEAIRSKTGNTGALTPIQMPLAIGGIEAGGSEASAKSSVVIELPEIAKININGEVALGSENFGSTVVFDLKGD